MTWRVNLRARLGRAETVGGKVLKMYAIHGQTGCCHLLNLSALYSWEIFRNNASKNCRNIPSVSKTNTGSFFLISQIIEFLEVQLEVLSILLRTVKLIVNCRWVTFSETRADGWNLISAKHNKISQKQHFFLFPPPCLISFVSQHSISLNGLERSSDWAVLITAPKYNPWLWCVCLHYLNSSDL